MAVLVGSGTGRTLLLALPALVLISIFVTKRRTLMPDFKDIPMKTVFRVIMIAILLYIGGFVFDQHLLGLTEGFYQFLDELCESAATFYFGLGSLLLARAGFLTLESEEEGSLRLQEE